MKLLFNSIKHNHSLLMILCCVVPLVAILALSYFNVLSSWGYYAIFLLCPMMHVFMHKGHTAHAKNNKSKDCH